MRTAPLLERDAALVVVDGALRSAATGAGRLLVVEAHAGLGKTRLLDEAVERAEHQGFQTLRAAGDDLERLQPFGLALQLFGPIAARAPEERERLFAGAAALAAPLLMPSGGTAFAGAVRRPSTLHGLHWLTSALADTAPLLLVVDDAHWADGPSVRFLAYLGRRLADLPVAVLVARRPPGSATPVLEEALAAVAAGPEAETVNLDVLSAGGVRRLVGAWRSPVAPSFATTCAELTGGNPLLVVELLRAADAGDVGSDLDGAELPRLASGRVLRRTLLRIARGPAGSLALAGAVAVLGDLATVGEAAALAGLAPPTARAAADALAATEVLTAGEPLDFVHPLLRAVVDAEIPAAERAAMHGRAAAVARAAGAPVAQVAAHVLLAPVGADADAVPTLRQAAAEAVAGGAPESAVPLLERALTEPLEPDRRRAVLLELAAATVAAGGADALAPLLRALELSPRPQQRAEVQLALGRLHAWAGDAGAAAAAFDAGLAELDGPSDLRAELEAAWMAVARLEVALRPDAARRLAVIAEREEPPTSLAESALLAQAANQLVFDGERRETAIALARRALDGGHLLAEETSDGLNWLVATAVLGWSDDLDGYASSSRAALEDARRRGSVVGFATASYALSFAEYRSGQLADAAADAERALQAEADGWALFVPAAQAHLAWALVDQAEVDAADRVLTGVDDARWQGSSMMALVHEARARVAMARGDAAAALEHARTCGAIFTAAVVANPACAPWRSRAALALDRLGDRDQALALAGEELAAARAFGAPIPIGIALRALGLIERGPGGLARLEEAVAVLAPSPGRLEHTRALVDHGAALRRDGRRVLARERLADGLARAREMGATALERQALEELETAGGSPRDRDATGLASLTAGERRVARLAAAGMTNREIAQTLFVTVKAVRWHLRNTYAKLGVGSREGLAELGLGQQGSS